MSERLCYIAVLEWLLVGEISHKSFNISCYWRLSIYGDCVIDEILIQNNL